jgi:hypothetical protein
MRFLLSKADSSSTDSAGEPGIESPDPMPQEPPEGVFGVAERPARGCGDGAMLSTRVATRGVSTPPVEGGRSRTRG